MPALKGKRVKATRACDRCKKKKTKCSGEQPCDRCSNDKNDCAYTSEYTRGRGPTIPTRIRPQAARIQEKTHKTVESEEDRPVGLPSSDLPGYPQTQISNSQSWGSDSQDFVSSSGGSIYDRTQRSLNGNALRHQQSSIFMFGDPPLPEVDGSFLFLPPAETVQAMIEKYFDAIAATVRFLHRPTVDLWMESYDTNFMSSENWQRSIRAILLMILASAQGHMNSESRNKDPGIRYFLAADHQLQRETGEIRLSSVQARLMQCMFLLSRSRINQCWSTFGAVVNMSVALGLHRRHSQEVGMDTVQNECRKRAFWSAYTLDKYLSHCLGRPQMFHDEDIDQELPLPVCDSDLQIASITTGEQSDVEMQATVFQIKLSTIIGKILKDLYSLRSLDKGTRLDLTDGHRHLLEQWRQKVVTSFGFDFPFEPPPISTSPIVPNQNAALMLAYYHVVIMLYRPFLLDTFSEAPLERARMKDHVLQCLDTCMSIIEIVNRLYEQDPAFRARWFAHYCGYTATVCLYVYVIRVYEQSPEIWTKYLKAAQKCQLQIDISAPAESFAQRCSRVLKELEVETLDCIQRMAGYSQYPIPPILSGLNGIWNWRTNIVVDRIDRWGFSSLTGVNDPGGYHQAEAEWATTELGASPRVLDHGAEYPTGQLHVSQLQEYSAEIRWECQVCISEIHKWTKAAADVLEHITRTDHNWTVIAPLLQIHAKTTLILLAGMTFTDEASFDVFLPDFRAITNLSASIHPQLIESAQKSGVHHVDLGILPALNLVSSRCRDKVVRSKAIDLLYSIPYREGIWDSIAIASISSWLRSMEVSANGGDETYIPGYCRVVSASTNLDLCNRTAKVYCKQRIGRNEVDAVHHEGLLSW